MNTNISFGSMFNPERISSRNNIEKIANPEHNIEGLKNDGERAKDFPAFPTETAGRSQIIKSHPAPKNVELTDSDKEFLEKLGSSKYGFHNDSNDFWCHSSKDNEDGSIYLSTGDGKIPNGTSRQDFAKNLIDEDTQAFQFLGKDELGGNKLITVVKNSDTNTLTMYTCDSKQCYPMEIDYDADLNKLGAAILDQLISVQGITIYKD